MRHILMIACAALMILAPRAGARAADIPFLSEFLFSAYEVLNYTSVCMAKDPEFIAQTSGSRGTALHYAEHVKDETIASLEPGDIALVLRTAALAAKIVSLRTLRRLDAADHQQSDAQIVEWCATRARSFVRDFIQHHDSNHPVILDALKRARE